MRACGFRGCKKENCDWEDTYSMRLCEDHLNLARFIRDVVRACISI